MMEFRLLKDSVINLLGAASQGEYQVKGYEPFPQDAADYRGKNRTVRVLYPGGEFSNQNSEIYDHEFKLDVEMCVTADAETDLDTLMNGDATQQELALAMASMRDSAEVADRQFDELLDLVFNVLASPANKWLGLEAYRVKSASILDTKKNRLLPFGEHAVLTGKIVFGIIMVEKATGGAVPTKLAGNNLTIESGE